MQYAGDIASVADEMKAEGRAKPLCVVGIAASAGGIAAIRRILQQLPPAFPAAVIVVQHLAPGFASHLAEVLQPKVALFVQQVREGDPLAPGHVFVAPPDWHVVVNPELALHLSGEARVHFVRPAADVLFQSMSEVAGNRAVAVVLSGSGTDGAEGIRAVKAAGGTIIVQNPEEAEYRSMPAAAVATDCADYVLPLDGIAPRLVHLMAVLQK